MSMIDANFPTDAEGKTYHVGTKCGQVANRIITVGDPHRARSISTFLDTIYFEYTSKRGFLTITGSYKGTAISIVAIGMGAAMMDFFVREVRHVVQGELVIFRFGSCGAINNATVGNIVVASNALFIYKNYKHFYENTNNKYEFSDVLPANENCIEILIKELRSNLKHVNIHQGLCATGDSFYSSQGRIGTHFADKNEKLIETLLKTHPTTEILEMEVYPLYHLADISLDKSISVVAAAMVFADRKRNLFLPPEQASVLEKEAAKSFLDAIVQIPVVNEHSLYAVWKK
eukprot:NODE_6_length_70510_cov_1.054395.p31 type:complete len:288 gc:universal NODE_6_length_70510_cov_1.054395:40444-41307(+)